MRVEKLLARVLGSSNIVCVYVDKPVMQITIPDKGPKVTSLAWSGLEEQFVTGHENGDVAQWDVKSSQKTQIVSDHSKTVTDIQMSKDRKNLVPNKEQPDCQSYPLLCRYHVHLIIKGHNGQAV